MDQNQWHQQNEGQGSPDNSSQHQPDQQQNQPFNDNQANSVGSGVEKNINEFSSLRSAVEAQLDEEDRLIARMRQIAQVDFPAAQQRRERLDVMLKAMDGRFSEVAASYTRRAPVTLNPDGTRSKRKYTKRAPGEPVRRRKKIVTDEVIQQVRNYITKNGAPIPILRLHEMLIDDEVIERGVDFHAFTVSLSVKPQPYYKYDKPSKSVGLREWFTPEGKLKMAKSNPSNYVASYGPGGGLPISTSTATPTN